MSLLHQFGKQINMINVLKAKRKGKKKKKAACMDGRIGERTIHNSPRQLKTTTDYTTNVIKTGNVHFIEETVHEH